MTRPPRQVAVSRAHPSPRASWSTRATSTQRVSARSPRPQHLQGRLLGRPHQVGRRVRTQPGVPGRRAGDPGLLGRREEVGDEALGCVARRPRGRRPARCGPPSTGPDHGHRAPRPVGQRDLPRRRRPVDHDVRGAGHPVEHLDPRERGRRRTSDPARAATVRLPTHRRSRYSVRRLVKRMASNRACSRAESQSSPLGQGVLVPGPPVEPRCARRAGVRRCRCASRVHGRHAGPQSGRLSNTSRVAVDRFMVMKWMPGAPSSSIR